MEPETGHNALKNRIPKVETTLRVFQTSKPPTIHAG